MPLSKQSPTDNSVRSLGLSDFDLRFDRYRIIQPKAELLMARSLAKYSQLAPVVCCQLEGSLVLVDGFKRLRAFEELRKLGFEGSYSTVRTYLKTHRIKAKVKTVRFETAPGAQA